MLPPVDTKRDDSFPLIIPIDMVTPVDDEPTAIHLPPIDHKSPDELTATDIDDRTKFIRFKLIPDLLRHIDQEITTTGINKERSKISGLHRFWREEQPKIYQLAQSSAFSKFVVSRGFSKILPLIHATNREGHEIWIATTWHDLFEKRLFQQVLQSICLSDDAKKMYPDVQPLIKAMITVAAPLKLETETEDEPKPMNVTNDHDGENDNDDLPKVQRKRIKPKAKSKAKIKSKSKKKSKTASATTSSTTTTTTSTTSFEEASRSIGLPTSTRPGVLAGTEVPVPKPKSKSKSKPKSKTRKPKAKLNSTKAKPKGRKASTSCDDNESTDTETEDMVVSPPHVTRVVTPITPITPITPRSKKIIVDRVATSAAETAAQQVVNKPLPMPKTSPTMLTALPYLGNPFNPIPASSLVAVWNLQRSLVSASPSPPPPPATSPPPPPPPPPSPPPSVFAPQPTPGETKEVRNNFSTPTRTRNNPAQLASSPGGVDADPVTFDLVHSLAQKVHKASGTFIFVRLALFFIHLTLVLDLGTSVPSNITLDPDAVETGTLRPGAPGPSLDFLLW